MITSNKTSLNCESGVQRSGLQIKINTQMLSVSVKIESGKILSIIYLL